MIQLPNGNIAFGQNANCTLSICPLETSILRYRPNPTAGGVFIVAFATFAVLHAIQGVQTHAWGFMASMIAGCVVEIIGYAGRIMIYLNPFDFPGFLIQIICITVAPVFFCSAIYVILSQIIYSVDRSVSRMQPHLFYWIFIPCDLISLILQAVGGALSCVAKTKDDIQVGVNISLAGLIFQVVTLTLFCVLFADYLLICWNSAVRYKLRPLKTFLGFMFASVILILVRCAYRIVELNGGYFSHLFRDETLFMALESAIMCVATRCLNLGHPGEWLDYHNPYSKHSEFELGSISAIGLREQRVKTLSFMSMRRLTVMT